jgi:hypothetical protein
MANPEARLREQTEMAGTRRQTFGVAVLVVALGWCGQAQAAPSGAAPPSPLRELAACLDNHAATGTYPPSDPDDAVILLVVSCQKQADAFTKWCESGPSSNPGDCAHVVFVTARGALDRFGG